MSATWVMIMDVQGVDEDEHNSQPRHSIGK